MNAYADAAYYTGTYLSGREQSIPSAQFPYYARDATMRIRQRTYGRVPETVPEEVKLCCCELAELTYCKGRYGAEVHRQRSDPQDGAVHACAKYDPVTVGAERYRDHRDICTDTHCGRRKGFRQYGHCNIACHKGRHRKLIPNRKRAHFHRVSAFSFTC